MYKAKARPEPSRVEKEEDKTSVLKHKRKHDKSELAYDQYLHGNQALNPDPFNKSGSQSSIKNYVNDSSQNFSHRSGLNIIHDSVDTNTARYFQKQERQSQSTRNLGLISDQKSQRTTNKKHT